VLKQVRLAKSEFNKAATAVQKDMQTAFKAQKTLAIDEVKEKVKEIIAARNDQFLTITTTIAENNFSDITDFPQISNTAFSLESFFSNGKVVNVVVTRLLDG
jgi:hypothetical protein